MSADIIGHWPMWVSLGTVAITIICYMLDRWSMELVSICVIAALLLLFSIPGITGHDGTIITHADLLAGFSNPALITIMALLIVGQGLFQTGALESLTKMLMRSYGKHPGLTLIITFTTIFITSAFTNNTPVVIMFLPIISAMAARMGNAASRLMIPLSFVSILAGMTTLIGTSTNLLAADAYARFTGNQLGFFDQTFIGLLLASIGGLYMIFTAFALLPERADFSKTLMGSGRQFVAQFEVTAGHFLAGKTAVAGMFPDLPDITVRMIQRDEKALLPPYNDVTLQVGDLVIIAATRRAITNLISDEPTILQGIWDSTAGEQDDKNNKTQLNLVEAVIAPGSRMAGRTIAMLGFRRLTQTVTLGIQRRSRMIRSQLSEIRLEAGDTLLLCGSPDAFHNLRRSRDLIMLEWSQSELLTTAKVQLARFIALAMVLAVTFGLASITLASVLAATAMVLLQCLNGRQAARALDLRIYLVIAAALSMGTALEATGAVHLSAKLVVDMTSPFGTLAVLSAIFLVVAILTNILSNAATAVLFAPVSLSAAAQIGADPLPFLLAVIYAANCAFATPIAYQTNMLVMAPGHYKFSDFLRFGGPLVIIMWVAFTIIAAWHFDL